MKRFFKWSGIVAFAALIPMLMAPTGGIPTILSLAKLTVSSPTGKLCASGANTGVTCTSNNSSTGHVAWASVTETRGTAGNQLGMLVTSTAAGNSTDTIFRVQVNGTTFFNVDGTGAVTGSNTALIARTAYANVGFTGATCGIGSNIGITACNHTGTGQYTLTLSNFSATPICVISTTGGAIPVSVTASSSTSAIVSTFTTAFASADVTSQANVICNQ